MNKKEYQNIKHEVKKGRGVIWILIGFIVFMLCGVLFLLSRELYGGNFIAIISCVIALIFLFLVISDKFGSDYEVIRAYEDKVIHIKKHQFEKEYNWNEILYKKEKKHYEIPTGKYSRIYRMKNGYSFYKDNQMLFSVYDNENKSLIEFIEGLIASETLNEKKTLFNGEEVIELKTNKSNKISVGLEIFALVAFGLIYLFVFLFTPFKDTWFLMVIYAFIVLVSIKYFKTEIKQLQQIIYVVKEKGFYILNKGQTKFYKFNEIDKAETECHMSYETVDYKLRIYKDNKELILLTNSINGFYEFLDILKERNLIKN